jgi:hypothetical protein
MRFLINILLFYLPLTLPDWRSWRCIFGISILSLAIRQCRHAHLLLFERYLLFIPISISQAIPDPEHRIPLVVLVSWQLFILFRRSLLRDRRCFSVDKTSTFEIS